MKYAIVNATLVMTDHLIPDGVIIIEDGKIADFGKANKISVEGLECIDVGGRYVGPGLIDIHTHAGAGTFFYEDPVFAAEKILEHGVTDVLPALYFNMNAEKLVHFTGVIREAMESGKAPNIIGLYMEAPYMNPKFGCDRTNNPWGGPIDKKNYAPVVDAAYDIARVWCLAPERENIEEFVDYVLEKNPNAKFDEFSLDIGQNYTQNVYIHSKYKAEERVLFAREEGLKANIFRIGNLTWRLSDGKFQRNSQDNGFLGRCRGLLKIGMYSKDIAEYPIDFTPVDECADAYVRLALHNRVNNIYNLYNPHMFTIESLGKKVFRIIKRVSRETFEKSLKELITDKNVAVLSFYSSIASNSKNVPMSNEFTVNELKKLGFRWSKIGIRYLSYMKKIR